MRAWLRRTVELHEELSAIAEVDPRWWLLAAGSALAEPYGTKTVYLACDAEPDADTMMLFRTPPAQPVVADAIARANAARIALRELDGTLPGQPLAVTLTRSRHGATVPNALEVAAFAVGSHCLIAQLSDPTLPQQLAAVLAGVAPAHSPATWMGAMPFVTISLGDEALPTARHGHRRAWIREGRPILDRTSKRLNAGPWLGLGRSGAWTVVSTCHLVVDGYGHARLTARIAELLAAAAPAVPSPHGSSTSIVDLPTLAAVDHAVPLVIVWREFASPTPRLVPLAYRLGILLHQRLGQPNARFSPTIQIPVARGHKHDPLRLRRRIVSATTSVRFDRGEPEPFAAFEARVRAVFEREAAGHGLVSRLLAAAAAVPVPVSWKRQSIGARRPAWLESFAEIIGGRALLSRLALDFPAPAMAAVSSASRLASDADPFGGCVITLLEDGTRGMITLAGTGFVGEPAHAMAMLDELLAQ